MLTAKNIRQLNVTMHPSINQSNFMHTSAVGNASWKRKMQHNLVKVSVVPLHIIFWRNVLQNFQLIVVFYCPVFISIVGSLCTVRS